MKKIILILFSVFSIYASAFACNNQKCHEMNGKYHPDTGKCDICDFMPSTLGK